MSFNATQTDPSSPTKVEMDLFRRQYLKVRENYENKIQELSIIKELVDTLRLTGTYEKNILFNEQIKIIKKYAPLEQIVLMLLNDDLQQLEPVAWDGNKGQIQPLNYNLLNESILGKAINQKHPVVINDKNEFLSPEEQHMFGGLSLLCIPVMHNKDAIGVLCLVHRTKNAFDQNQVNFYSLVADQLATAIVLSRFYAKMIKEEGKRFLLSRFFSKTVSDKILGSQGLLRLGGERKRATIVFADLHGFTSLSEKLDEEEVVEILNAFFSYMTPIIFKNEGTLDKLLGDGMMAIFGAPISHADDPVRALRTVIEMIKGLHTFNEKNRAKGWPDLKIGIGVNTGNVVAGYIGSEDHLNYTVIGDAVNVASRLQSISQQNEILITKAVKEAIEDRLSDISGLKGLTPLPAQKVKGKQEAIDVYRVEF
ncbi:MAG: GAF domain-containing protein [Deltaproteobacteria bacterium]|nr:GAF domain-containing protein [Deltaproteobacteria bacterium]